MQASSGGGGLFVVHKHAATRLHYDLRLEMDGVLVSWAVPRGPSLDPAEKRLAVQTEDHPLDYGDFEGVIQPGNYGAGAVILWDRGRWEPVPDPEYPGGMADGKLLFDLHGHKLRGRFTLVKTRGKGRGDNEWLLIKKPDAWARTTPMPETSVLTARTVEDVAEGRTPGDRLREALRAEPVPRRALRAADVELMLADPRDAATDEPGWVWEIKYDGFRLLAAREQGATRLYYRRGSEVSARYPEITRALAALPYQDVIFDGELIVADEVGRPSFGLLQQRAGLDRSLEIKRAALTWPAQLVVFDLLAFEGHDLRGLPLVKRKALLEPLLPAAGPLRYCEHLEVRGADLFHHALRLGLEGVVGKRADAPYRGGRGPAWIKLRREHTADFAVIGYTPPEGTRVGLGAMHLAFRNGEGWIYAGGVGTGLDDATLRAARARLEPLARATPACTGAPKLKGMVWVEPEVVCEVRFHTWTHDDLLRQAVFLRFRDDKAPEDCREGPDGPTLVDGATTVAPAPAAPAPAPAAPARPPPPDEPLALTNQGKIFWPDEGYTKGDLCAYYRDVAPWILPYLKDRPLVMTRFPDGIRGKSFFQHDAPNHIPKWIRTETMYSSATGEETRYIICDDARTLVYLANLGTVPLHVWASRVPTLQSPDWTILDLDPKDAPFAHVIEVARALHALCEDIGLPHFVKTSGKSGLHVLVPLPPGVTFDQGRELALLLAKIVVDALPDKATLARTIADRGGRVYVDCYQNGHGQLLVAPLCVRPEPGAPVSTPLRWREVNGKLDPRAFTIKTVPARLKKQKPEPMAPLLTTTPDLLAALTRLQARLTK